MVMISSGSDEATLESQRKPILGYWNIRGLGSQIRYELVYLGIEFNEDKYEQGPAPKFDRAQWLAIKDSLELKFPNLPYFIDEQTRLTDPHAIMKFIANKYGPHLLGNSPAQIGQVEMIVA